MAAIHVRFPASGIIRCFHAVHGHDAHEFFRRWPDLLRAAEDEYSGDVHLSTAFQETGTQNAFLAISAQLKNMEEATKANREHLAIITHRTEQFSPSKQSHQRTATPYLALDNLPPLSRFLPAGDSTRFEHPMYLPLLPQYLTALSHAPSLPPVPRSDDQSMTLANHLAQISPVQSQVPAITPLRCPISQSPTSLVQHLPPFSTSLPCATPTFPSTPTRPLQHVGNLPSPSGSRLTCGQEPLTPFIVAHSKENVYCILPLTPCVPGLAQTRSSRDVILPPPEVFSPLNASVSPAYPAFHTQNCTWNAVLSLVQQPHLLWTSYAPKNLGEYADIKSLWQAWEEGMSVEGIGCMPPLRVIDERWGSCKGRRAVWRPQGDALVSCLFFAL